MHVRKGVCNSHLCVHLLCCWHAEFQVSETPTGRVTDPKKLSAIKKVLALPEHTGTQSRCYTGCSSYMPMNGMYVWHVGLRFAGTAAACLKRLQHSNSRGSGDV
jgi:hypothetical protein